MASLKKARVSTRSGKDEASASTAAAGIGAGAGAGAGATEDDSLPHKTRTTATTSTASASSATSSSSSSSPSTSSSTETQHPETKTRKGASSSTSSASSSASTSSSSSATETKTIMIQFQTPNGETTGSQLEIPSDITLAQLQELINDVLKNEEKLPYVFYLNDEEIVESLAELIRNQKASTEAVLSIVYQPQAVFRVRSVTRCTSSLPGHTEAILHVSFSADGKHLASGSGDTTVRIWDVNTEMPKLTMTGHKHWVMAVAWAPDGKVLASGCMDGELRVWNPESGKAVGKPLKGHKGAVTAIAWEPMHNNPDCVRLASASKDASVRIWDTSKSTCLIAFGGHTQPIRALRWGGANVLYSGAQDRTVKAWDLAQGKLLRSLEGHGHWVNDLAINADYVLRTGPYDHKGEGPTDSKEIVEVCKAKYDAIVSKDVGELLVSCSDDFTLFLWNPLKTNKPVVRMTGHQQPVNFVRYSPDGRYIASASFDKSVRLWHGTTGKFIAVFRGHVQAVYQLCWSADSRLLASSSKDSTIKLWNIKTKKMLEDLPGHADEVYAVDWSPDGERIASGGKDKVLKIWRQ